MFGSSIKLGKIAGISIDINYSLIFIAIFLTYSLTSFTLPQSAPGYTSDEYLAFGILTSLLFFFSILWHELAHGLMARFFRVNVRRIVLFFMGGVAEIENEPASAGQEFWIAIVGPLSSFILGIIFLLGGFLFENGSMLGEVSAWLGLINILLAGFNILPGFPLDGGRVLRAFLWWTTGNHLTATRWASYSGQAIGYLSIIIGIFAFLSPAFGGQRFWSVLWGLLMGWFLIGAAQHHLRHATERNRLKGINIGQMVQRQVFLKPEWPLSYAMDIMAMQGPYAVLPVADEQQRPVGYLTLEILRAMRHLNWAGITVEMVMRPLSTVQQLEAYRDLYDVVLDGKLQNHNYFLIIDNHQPVGMLSQQQILAFVEQRSRGY